MLLTLWPNQAHLGWGVGSAPRVSDAAGLAGALKRAFVTGSQVLLPLLVRTTALDFPRRHGKPKVSSRPRLLTMAPWPRGLELPGLRESVSHANDAKTRAGPVSAVLGPCS